MSTLRVEYKRVNNNIVKATLFPSDYEKHDPIVPIIVLDVSSSMHGKRIVNCLNTIRHIFSKVGSIHLLTYNHSCVDHGIITTSSLMNKIHATGCTSFRSAYETLVQVISRKNGPCQVVFMTDGEDTVRCGNVDSDRNWLKENLKDMTCVIHTIGIESESHTQHMLNLSRCGSSDGTYGYLSSKIEDSYLKEADRLVDILGCAKEVDFNGAKYFIGTQPVETYIQDSETECGGADPMEEIDYLTYRVNELISQGVSADIKDIQFVRDQASSIFTASGRQPRVTRKLLRERLALVHDLINNFYQMINSRSITHEKLAMLNVAARDARSSRFTKAVVSRTNQNVTILEREDNDLLAITEEFRDLDLQDQPEDFTCMLTCMDVSDLLHDGDCLGIGVRATVREACIVDPTLLKIDGISTSHFGCGAFLEAAEYSSKMNHVRYGNSTNVVVDSSRNEVSGVLPLYINPTHWKIAKLYLRRMSGHLCCKDPLLGTNRTIFYSYLHVYRFCRVQGGEFYGRMTGLLRETLEHVYEKMTNIIPSPNDFCDSIHQRMPDVVPSISLLGEAYSALSLPCDRQHLQDYMAEEALRRKKNSLSIRDVCFIDHALWVLPFVHANTPSHDVEPFVNIISYVSTNYPEALASLKNHLVSNIESSNTSTTSDIIVLDPETYHPIITLPDWVTESFSHLSQERQALVALQACDLENVTYCLAEYRDIFTMTEDLVHSILKDRAVKSINLLRTSTLGSIINIMRSRSSSALAERFCRSDVSLLERVAILNGECYIGRNITEFFRRANSLEELKMLFTGEYDIAPLINYPSPVLIPTVMDIDKRSSYLPHLSPSTLDYHGIHHQGQISYSGCWIPNHLRLKRLCRIYSRSELMSIIPQAEPWFVKYYP